MLKDKQQVQNKDLSVIGKTLKIDGNIESSGVVDLLGNFTGDGNFAMLNIRESGVLSGKIKVEMATIYGKFEGELVVKKLVLMKTASITGNVMYESIAVEDGAEINAKMEKVKV